MPNWGIRRVAAVLLAIYAVAASTVVLWPAPIDGGLKGELKSTIGSLQDAGMPPSVDYAFIESAANIVMFVPLGLLITLMAARRLWFAAPIIGVVLSTSAEVAQLIFLPDRFPTLADVAANSSGALVGTLMVLAVRGIISATAVVALRNSRHLAEALASGMVPKAAHTIPVLALVNA